MDKREPIAWMVYTVDGQSAYVTDNPSDIKEGQSAYALYPGPFEQVLLTEEEIKTAFHAARNAKLGASQDNSRHRLSVIEIARAVEQAAWEKNHG
jgi:hypothetical protein